MMSERPKATRTPTDTTTPKRTVPPHPPRAVNTISATKTPSIVSVDSTKNPGLGATQTSPSLPRSPAEHLAEILSATKAKDLAAVALAVAAATQDGVFLDKASGDATLSISPGPALDQPGSPHALHRPGSAQRTNLSGLPASDGAQKTPSFPSYLELYQPLANPKSSPALQNPGNANRLNPPPDCGERPVKAASPPRSDRLPPKASSPPPAVPSASASASEAMLSSTNSPSPTS